MIDLNMVRAGCGFFILSASLAFSGGTLAGAEKQDEMGQYRHILERPVATVQDLVDLIMMTRGDFLKHPTPTKRIEEAHQEGWLKNHAATDELDRGTLAFALVKSYPIHRGWLFLVTHWNHYALRDAQQAGVLSARNSDDHKVSGEQLVGAINAAEEYKVEKEKWSENH